MKSLFNAFILVSLFFLSLKLYANTELRFCYEDKNVAPMFIGAGQEIPLHDPGASIELLRQLDKKLDGLTISYQRKPWQRCLNELKHNNVDAVIASYRKGRESFAVFPTTSNKIPDPSRAFNQFSSCLVGGYKFREKWRTREIFQKRAFTLALPNGYGLSKTLEQEPFFIHYTNSRDTAFELVDKGVVDATVELCKIGNIEITNFPNTNKDVQAIYPPYELNHGYLVFSRQFYQQNKKMSLRIWQKLISLDSGKLLIEYLTQTRESQSLTASNR